MALAVSLIQFGFGNVGRAVVARVLRLRDELEWRYGLELSYRAVCDSRGAIMDMDGIRYGDLQRALAAKAAGTGLDELEPGYHHQGLLDIVDIAADEQSIVIDVTAADDTVPALLKALSLGCRVVLANKKPLTQRFETFRRLTAGGRLRYEATVGAGVPVIATLTENLIASGDVIYRVEGCLSGTLGFLTTGLQAGEGFAALVRRAHELGYTEPDPRDDLGGMDVARKALILARTLGWPLELDQVAVEALFPPAMATGTVAEFLTAAASLDAPYRRRMDKAVADGKTLRYVATLAGGQARVGLEEVPLDSPLGRLQGTDNLIAFHTEVYRPTPLVLQGRGAGAAGTAAGVVADIVALARR
jgi:homoserine dehydrogenase